MATWHRLCVRGRVRHVVGLRLFLTVNVQKTKILVFEHGQSCTPPFTYAELN